METRESATVRWLLAGDISVAYQTRRDLLDEPENMLEPLRLRIAEEGWGKRFLELRDNAAGTWGGGYYGPKWVSTHYTLLNFMNMGFPPGHPAFRRSAEILLEKLWPNRGWVLKDRMQDLCVVAMVLSICCYAGIRSASLNEIVDYILSKQYPDGGWNCNWDKGDAKSSVHTTLTVLEALRDYAQGHYAYRAGDAAARVCAAEEFLLKKQLFRSVRTGEIFDKRMLMLSFPCRWKYDILRSLDYFQSVAHAHDPRMDEALDILEGKMRKNGRWPVQQKYAGRIHFDMEPTGGDSRWNTLRALRVLKRYRPEVFSRIVFETSANPLA